MTHQGIEYDFNSIMHYGPFHFSANGHQTIAIKHVPAEYDWQRDETEATDFDYLHIYFSYCEGNRKPLACKECMKFNKWSSFINFQHK